MNNCSILILTKNEERCIEKCIQSVNWSNDIVIYDSFSDDDTELIASKYKVRFIQRENQNLKKLFGGDEAEHRNWGLEKINYLNDWVLILDADERLTKKARDEILEIINIPNKNVSSENCSAYRLRRRDFLDGVHLKHVQLTKWYIRLIKPKFVRYDRSINCSMEVKGNIRNLKNFIDHYPFEKGIYHWIERHNAYSTSEAFEIIKNKKFNIKRDLLKVFFCKSISKRKIYQKKLFYSLSLRPLLKFILLYFIKLGFLDGKAGLKYSILQTIYEYFITIKVIESK